ncbi:uncharacterized protein LOC134209688 [Armigeres subalbatus]|uniref:uncharacterized protein LOC134209688 n=1 Tax=Armigeres subalbatus TaxID=124917 RepID=UPI002ED2C69E
MTLLETVVLNIVDDHGISHKARALLDSASMSNFISKPLAKILFSRRSTVDFLVLKQPSSELSTTPIDISAWKIPSVELADPHFNVPRNVGLVIGSDTYWELHTGRKIYLGEGIPWVFETLFGWAVTGSASRSATCIPRFCYLSTADDRLEAALRKFWDMETIPSTPVRSTEESICEEHYAATTMRNSAGRYIVRLPRTEDSEKVLGESRSIADRRFLGLERRLDRNPATKESYHRFMEEYLQLGHMQEVPESVDDRIEHSYIPHHVVFNESSTTTKVRVVFDASCKTSSGYSLNDTLLVGPVVQQDLYSIYTRFRTKRIAIVADVEKICPSDPIVTFELQTVTYGTASAPYLATKTLQQIAINQAEFYPAAVDPRNKNNLAEAGAPVCKNANILDAKFCPLSPAAGSTSNTIASELKETSNQHCYMDVEFVEDEIADSDTLRILKEMESYGITHNRCVPNADSSYPW